MTETEADTRVPWRHRGMAAVETVVQVLSRGLLATVSALLFWSVVPVLAGWSSEVVVSGSMMPLISPGDVVVSQPVDARALLPGQVVLVSNPARPGTLLMHRLVSRYPDGSLKTKGDANADDDSTPIPAAMVRGLPRLRIPYIGMPMLWLRERQYSLVGFACLLLIVAAMASVGRSGSDPDGSTDDEAATEPTATRDRTREPTTAREPALEPV